MLRIQRLAASVGTSPFLVRTVPRLSLVILLLSVVYQYLVFGQHDPYNCNALLSSGTWRSRTGSSLPRDAFAKWEPDGCRMREMSRDDISSCFKDRHLVIVGDSTMRQIYFAAMTRLDHYVAEKAILDFAVSVDKHQNLSRDVEGVKLDFIWDPWLNSTSLLTQLARFRDRPGSADYERLLRQEGRDSPALIVVGTPGLWAARQGGDRYLELFREGINVLMPYLHKSIDESVALPSAKSQSPFDEMSNHVLVAPVPIPAYDMLTSSRARSITPKRIDAMNWNLEHLEQSEQSHIVWAYHAMTEGHDNAMLEDGIHAVDVVAERKLDVIINAHCNAGLVRRGYANQITCCTPYPSLGRVQLLLLGLNILTLPVLVLSRQQDAFPSPRTQRVMDTLMAVATLLVVAVYCLLADRTHVLAKQDKHFDVPDFALPLVGLAVLAALSLRSRVPTTQSQTRIPTTTSFLSREQTDEWKGWMLVFILMYNYHAALESSAMFKAHKFLVATFIFLFTYSHTMYILRTEDYSFRRVAYVLLRLNLLTCLLVFTMSSEWVIYTAPLVTFWFGVTYTSLACFKKANSNPLGFFLKIVAFAACTTYLVRSTRAPERLASMLKSACGIYWDLNNLRAYFGQDRFIPYFGILTAAATHRVSVLRRRQHGINAQALFERINNALDRVLMEIAHPERDAIPVKPIMILFSFAYLVVFIILTFVSEVYHNNDSYTIYHPYTSPWFVLSAIVARNSFRRLRELHIPLAAALGQISLEAYVLHHHIWLASDGAGVLRIGSQSHVPRATEVMIITAIFIWASAKCQSATLNIVFGLTGTQRREQMEDVSLDSALPVKDDKRSPVPWQNAEAAAAAEQVIGEGKTDSSSVSPSALRLRIVGLLAMMWLGNMIYGV
ncbi:Putative cas1p 10 TM acyl transferase domain-containing protein [Colletotrichum destructivum]|uniref:Cas1p 10 TM acyl transferase domain-containing protein n=1 Tax=Colletotrichum destructivum TaxID=34406 RepID=A0AAX4HXP7_9PEZI|nr:Putative cas1p 10 TM acyl transferase domain-containing protein [Colletotrichum destructivum]